MHVVVVPLALLYIPPHTVHSMWKYVSFSAFLLKQREFAPSSASDPPLAWRTFRSNSSALDTEEVELQVPIGPKPKGASGREGGDGQH